MKEERREGRETVSGSRHNSDVSYFDAITEGNKVEEVGFVCLISLISSLC